MKKYTVINSPWLKSLPNCTVVTTTDDKWFVREDGKPLFEKGRDHAYDKRGTFKLFPHEIKAL